MCSGDDHTCPEFELHRKQLLDDLDHERRGFLKSAFAGRRRRGAAWAASGTLATPASAQTHARPAHLPLPAGERRTRCIGAISASS